MQTFKDPPYNAQLYSRGCGGSRRVLVGVSHRSTIDLLFLVVLPPEEAMMFGSPTTTTTLIQVTCSSGIGGNVCLADCVGSLGFSKLHQWNLTRKENG